MEIEEGLSVAINRIEKCEHPVLVAVHGPQDAGKSYMISRLNKYFAEHGWDVAVGEGYMPPQSEEELHLPEFRCDLFLFHMSWQKHRHYPSVILDVAVYNPNFHKPPEGDYGIMIENHNSKKKSTSS
ncbi:MAG: hypothetical protein V1900_01990 [Candidatus Aenigmatarchaeota archaeon]